MFFKVCVSLFVGFFFFCSFVRNAKIRGSHLTEEKGNAKKGERGPENGKVDER